MLERLGLRAPRARDRARCGIAAAFVAYFALGRCAFVYESCDFHDIANGLIAMPLWIPQSSFVAGASAARRSLDES